MSLQFTPPLRVKQLVERLSTISKLTDLQQFIDMAAIGTWDLHLGEGLHNEYRWYLIDKWELSATFDGNSEKGRVVSADVSYVFPKFHNQPPPDQKDHTFWYWSARASG